MISKESNLVLVPSDIALSTDYFPSAKERIAKATEGISEDFFETPTSLNELERVIETGISSILLAGQALAEIRQGKLYKPDYSTFEEYLAVRWQMGRARGYQLINSSNTLKEMSTIVDNGTPLPTNEGQLRELAKVKKPDERVEIWIEVLEAGNPTAQKIKEKVKLLSPSSETVKAKKDQAEITKEGLKELLADLNRSYEKLVERDKQINSVITGWAESRVKVKELEKENTELNMEIKKLRSAFPARSNTSSPSVTKLTKNKTGERKRAPELDIRDGKAIWLYQQRINDRRPSLQKIGDVLGIKSPSQVNSIINGNKVEPIPCPELLEKIKIK